MTAEALVATLRERGVILRLDGDQLVIRPASAVRPHEVEALRQFKAEILTLLASPTTMSGVMSWRYPWPGAIAGLGPHRVVPLDLCALCSCGTWARYGTEPLCFACAKIRAAEDRQ